MPPGESSELKKSILPELLNQKFLWHNSYHHYTDWEAQMRESYDQFNLLEVPQESKDQASLYFSTLNCKRRVPQGIFPDARAPRTVLRPPGDSLESSWKEAESTLDAMTKFERSPMQTMLQNELAKNSDLCKRQLSVEMQAITNL